MTPPQKRLLTALALSLLAHWVLVAFAPVTPPHEEKDTVIMAKITFMPAPPTPTPAAQRPTPAAPKPPPKAKKIAPQIQPGAVVAAIPAAQNETPVVVEPTPPEPVVAAEKAPEISPKPVEPVAPMPLPPEPPPLPTQEPEPLAMPPTSIADASKYPSSKSSKGAQQLAALPRVIDLNYKAGYGKGENYPMPIGNFKLRFEHEGNKYELKTSGQASGLFRFVYPGILRMKSVGRLSEKGLVPDEFQMFREREGNAAPPRKVVFDHTERLIRLHEKAPVAMEGQTFDALTFIVQFYFAMPDGDEVTMQVVSPTRLDTYTLKRGGKETLDTPQGKIDTEIWRGSRKSGAGSAEFWLAPSWHYVPFRVRLEDDKEQKAHFDLDSIAIEANQSAVAPK